MTTFNKFQLSADDKLSMPGLRPDTGAAGGTVILKVKRSGYVPLGFTVRTRIDDLLFTASGSADAIDAARQDASVDSISLATALRQIR